MVQGLWNFSRLRCLAAVVLIIMLLSSADTMAQIFAPLDVNNPYPAQSSHDIVLRPGTATVYEGNFAPVADSTAAGGFRMTDAGSSQSQSTPLGNPAHSFEMTFNAVAGRPYRVWMRMKAPGTVSNYYQSDSVWVQFSDSVDIAGNAVYRMVDGQGIYCELADNAQNIRNTSGWGWQDIGTGFHTFGPAIFFASTGQHTIRVQRREDGVSIDQIVLSTDPASFFNKPPGSKRKWDQPQDTRILNANNPAIANTLIANDGFGYTGNLNGGIGGTGYSGAWTAMTGNPAIAAGSLSYLTVPTSGNKLSPTTGQRSYRNFASPVANSGTKWVSFMAARTVAGAPPSNHAGFSLRSAVNGGGTTEIFLGKPGFSATNWGIDHAGTVATSNIAFATSAFLLYKLDFTASTLTVSMWVNPPLNEGSLGTPNAQLLNRPHSTNIPSMLVSTGTNATNYQFDEFRIGNTFSDVTSSGGGTPPPSLLDNKLDVVSWNVHFNEGTDGYNLPLRVASHMAIQNADVICLNELPTLQSTRDTMRNHLIAVSGQPWSDWYFDENGSNGNGIIVRTSACSVTSSAVKSLTGVQASPRSCLQATVSFNSKNVNVFVTHLDSSSAPESSRVTQIQQVRDFANEKLADGVTPRFPLPRIICGDFNTTNSTTIGYLTATYHDAWPWGINGYTPDRSFKYTDNTSAWTRGGSNRIDYHFFAPMNTPSVIELSEARIVDTRDMFTYVPSGVSPEVSITVSNADDRGVRPSDHNMIKASFLIP